MTGAAPQPEARFREAAGKLVDLVFTEDMEYFDSLPGKVERELGTPLAALSDSLNENRPLEAIRSAAVLVEEIAEEIQQYVPPELGLLIREMRESRLSTA